MGGGSATTAPAGWPATQYRPVLVHQTGEKGVRLVVGAFTVIGAAVEGEVEAEGQASHGASLGGAAEKT